MHSPPRVLGGDPPPPQTVAAPSSPDGGPEQEAAVNTGRVPTLFPGAGPQILSCYSPCLCQALRTWHPGQHFAQTRSESELDIQGQADHAKDMGILSQPAAFPGLGGYGASWPAHLPACPGRLAGPGACKLTPYLPLFAPCRHPLLFTLSTKSRAGEDARSYD